MTTNRVQNIVSIFQQANFQELKEGLTWYPTAKAECLKMSLETGKPLEVVVAVVAALSPLNKWETNLANAKSMLESDEPETVVVSTTNGNRDKAAAIIRTEDTSILSGVKVTAFFTNIMGGDVVTVDFHAKNIANMTIRGVKSTNAPRGHEYEVLATAYTAAAAMVGIKAHEMQAITWLTWRRLIGVTK